MNNFFLKRTATTLIAAAFVAGFGIASFADKTPTSEDYILLGEDNFPCDAFCAFLSDSSINTDGNAYLSRSEREAVTELDLDDLGDDLDDLSGIEYFPNLTTLSAARSGITSVDLSGNTALTNVDLRDSSLSDITVGNNPDLKELRLMGTEIDRLDISMCRQLIDVYYYGSIEENDDGDYICTRQTDDGDYHLSFPYDTELELLNLNDQIIFEDAALCSSLADPAYDQDEDGILDASEIDNITVLNLGGSGISDLTGIGYLYYVEELYCNGNGMSSLDVSSLKKLKVLDCSNNSNLTALDLSGLNNLTTLLCYTTRISSLDLSDATELIRLDCCGCSLTSLDLSGLEDLTFLDCGFQPITSLNISDCSNLKTLYCADIDVTDLDLSNNPLLERLYCYGSSDLTKIDISNNPKLYCLHMPGCPVTKINISHCPYLLEAFLNGTYYDETYKKYTYDENGSSITCELQLSSTVEVITISGWQEVDGNTYFYDENGVVVTGWQ
ncbi:MAG: hypothetical protein J5883_03100, partial [Clostridiales bacterium]|nr:hypothetical protein [Clostridiales bacterium]